MPLLLLRAGTLGDLKPFMWRERGRGEATRNVNGPWAFLYLAFWGSWQGWEAAVFHARKGSSANEKETKIHDQAEHMTAQMTALTRAAKTGRKQEIQNSVEHSPTRKN